MLQLNLFDRLHSPAVIHPVISSGDVIQGKADFCLVLPHKRMAWDQAEIELHQHIDGSWMWSTSFQTANHGASYKVGAKWGKFANTKADALYHACNELRDRLKNKTDNESRLILAWIDSINLNLV